MNGHDTQFQSARRTDPNPDEAACSAALVAYQENQGSSQVAAPIAPRRSSSYSRCIGHTLRCVAQQGRETVNHAVPVEPCGVARGLLSQFSCPLRLAEKFQHGGGKCRRQCSASQAAAGSPSCRSRYMGRRTPSGRCSLRVPLYLAVSCRNWRGRNTRFV
jgi:hypothetical protein